MKPEISMDYDRDWQGKSCGNGGCERRKKRAENGHLCT